MANESENEAQTKIWYEEIPISKIDVQKNVRTEIGDVAGLMTSIDQQGLLHPVGTYIDATGRYILRYGHRRLAACKKLGWTRIPSMVSNKVVNPSNYRDFLLENFSENKNRSDTSPVEDGSLFVELQNEHKMSFSEISAATGIPTSYVKNAVDAFLKTPTEFKPSVGYIVGGTKKKGKFSSAIVDMITRPHLSKEESKKLFAYVKSHDEATIHKVRLIVRLMTRSTNRLTFEQAIEKVDSLNVHTLFVVVKKDKAREAVKRYNKPLSRLMIEVLTGKIEPIPGLIYKGATRSDKEE